MNNIIKSIILILFVYSFTNIFAGGVITVEDSRRGQTVNSKTYIKDHMIRMESTINGKTNVMIFNAEKEEFYNLDLQKKTYLQMTKDDIEKIGEKMDDVSKMIEDKLKDLPKEQQEMMKKMMKGKMDFQPKHESRVEYELVSTGEKVMEWSCDKYISKKDGRITKEIWLADWTNVGLKENYSSVMKGIEKFFKKFTDKLSDKVSSNSLSIDYSLAEKGMPIKTVRYNLNGEKSGSSIVKEIKEEDIPFSLFIIPSDFKKEDPFSRMNFQ